MRMYRNELLSQACACSTLLMVLSAISELMCSTRDCYGGEFRTQATKSRLKHKRYKKVGKLHTSCNLDSRTVPPEAICSY